MMLANDAPRLTKKERVEKPTERRNFLRSFTHQVLHRLCSPPENVLGISTEKSYSVGLSPELVCPRQYGSPSEQPRAYGVTQVEYARLGRAKLISPRRPLGKEMPSHPAFPFFRAWNERTASPFSCDVLYNHQRHGFRERDKFRREVQLTRPRDACITRTAPFGLHTGRRCCRCCCFYGRETGKRNLGRQGSTRGTCMPT